MENHEKWFLRKLEAGCLLSAPSNPKVGERPVSGDWSEGEAVVGTEDLYRDYSDAMAQVNERYPKAETRSACFCTMSSARGARTRERVTPGTSA